MANPQNIEKHKFKKGQSGNLNGRPKKLPELDILLSDVINDDTAKGILNAMIAKARKGDVRAAELILNRAYGKPKENEGLPTEMIINVVRKRRDSAG